MDAVATGLIAIFNGLWTLLAAVFSPLTITILVLIACGTWLAVIEVDELDRQARKPTVMRH